MKFNRILLVVVSLALIVFALAGCGKDTAQDSQKKLNVVATTTMLTDLVKEIGGDHVTVQGLMGPGVLKYPAHPYTAALLRSIPILHKGRGQRLEPIRGSTPDPYDRPKGCQFAPRCDFCCEKCRQEMPPEVPMCDGHAVRCWNAEQVYAGHREEVESV